MHWLIDQTAEAEKAAKIIRSAGGEVIGRTRLQKLAYLLEITGLGQGLSFEYRHYRPYSEQLTNATMFGRLNGLLQEEERAASWGGSYSIFRTSDACESSSPEARSLISAAVNANPIDLELAATAAFLAREGHSDAWAETARRKPEKAGRLESAKALYRTLLQNQYPNPLPTI